MKVEQRQNIEKKIITCIVQEAIKKGFLLTIYDGDAHPIKGSNDEAAIMKELFACDEEWIILHDQDKQWVGSMLFIYGNDGYDVVADYSWTEKDGRNTHPVMEQLLDQGPVKELTDQLEKEHSK